MLTLIKCLYGYLIAATVVVSSAAAINMHSGRNEFADNPFIAVGVNPTTNVVTGYFSSLLTAPGNTHACRFVFRGSLTPDSVVRLAIKDALPGNEGGVAQGGKDVALLTARKNAIKVDLPRLLAPGDCDWVLESMGGPYIETTARGYSLSVDTGPDSDWIGVAAIRSKRAYFHSAADAATVRKAFLVAGDVVYVMEEKAGWYRVRFTHALKETAGWIKISDTIQF